MTIQANNLKIRVVRLVERLGLAWDNDPRVAFVEIGIFGKWGEQHFPQPTDELQKIVGDPFSAAFKNKKISTRRNWEYFQDFRFGEYWDSWAHYDQMRSQGLGIAGKSVDFYQPQFFRQFDIGKRHK